jgi:hypothetical protein
MKEIDGILETGAGVASSVSTRLARPSRSGRRPMLAVLAVATTLAAGLLSACVGSTASAPAKSVVICGQALGPKRVLGPSWPPGAPRHWVPVPIRVLEQPRPRYSWPTYLEPSPPVDIRFSSSCADGVILGRMVGVVILSRSFSSSSHAYVVAARVQLFSRSNSGTASLTFGRNIGERVIDESLRVPIQSTGA